MRGACSSRLLGANSRILEVPAIDFSNVDVPKEVPLALEPGLPSSDNLPLRVLRGDKRLIARHPSTKEPHAARAVGTKEPSLVRISNVNPSTPLEIQSGEGSQGSDVPDGRWRAGELWVLACMNRAEGCNQLSCRFLRMLVKGRESLRQMEILGQLGALVACQTVHRLTHGGVGCRAGCRDLGPRRLGRDSREYHDDAKCGWRRALHRTFVVASLAPNGPRLSRAAKKMKFSFL